MKVILISILIFGIIVLYRRFKFKKSEANNAPFIVPDKIEPAEEIGETAKIEEPQVPNITVVDIVDSAKNQVGELVDSIKPYLENVEKEYKKVVEAPAKPKRKYTRKKKN
jgi:hypothetical protein